MKLLSIKKSGIIFFIILVTFALTFVPNNNEIAYLTASRFWFNSIDSWYLGDSIWTSYLWNQVYGFLDFFVHHNLLVFSSRLLVIILWVNFFTKIQNLTKLSDLKISSVIIVFLLLDQNFVGGAWMIGTFEPKGFAWLLVCHGLIHLYREKYLYGFIFFTVAVLFHVLVAGYIYFVAMACFIFTRRHLRYMLVFGSISATYALFLYFHYANNSSSENTEISTYALNWMVNVRNPHHLNIFKDLDFFKRRIPGILMTLLSPIFFSKVTMENTKVLKPLMTLWSIQVLLLILMLCLQNSHFLLYYFLRINTLLAFVVLLAVVYSREIELSNRVYFVVLSTLTVLLSLTIILSISGFYSNSEVLIKALLISLIMFVTLSTNNLIYPVMTYSIHIAAVLWFLFNNVSSTLVKFNDYHKLMTVWNQVSNPKEGQILDILDGKGGRNRYVPYVSGCDPYVYWKLTPTSDSLIYIAGKRLRAIETSPIDSILTNTPEIEFVVSNELKSIPEFEILARDNEIFIYGRMSQKTQFPIFKDD